MSTLVLMIGIKRIYHVYKIEKADIQPAHKKEEYRLNKIKKIIMKVRIKPGQHSMYALQEAHMYKNIKNSKRLRYKKIKVFGILLLLIFSGMVTMSKAEESNQSLKALLSSNKTRFWFNSGFGPSTVKIASGGALSFQYSHLLVSLIFDHNRENILSGSKRPTEWISEIGITGGTSVGNRFGIIAFSFGPAYVAGIRRGNFLYSESAFLSGGTHYYEKEQFSTIGFTVRSHFIFTPRRFFGVGAHLYANLNAEEAFIGAIGGLYLGKFR